MKFSYIDFFLFGGIAVGAYFGYRGGFIKKLFNLLALLGSIVIASKLMTTVGQALIDLSLMSEPLAHIVGFALVLGALMTATIMIYRRFGKAAVAKSTSQVFGIIFGVIEGMLIISLILLALRVFDAPDRSTQSNSIFYKPLLNVAPKTFDLLRSYLPGAGDFREELSKTFKGSNIFESGAGPGKGI